MGFQDIFKAFDDAFADPSEVMKKALDRKVLEQELHRLENEVAKLEAEEKMNPCKVENCGKTDDKKPMTFRGEDWCSELHRKILLGELAEE